MRKLGHHSPHLRHQALALGFASLLSLGFVAACSSTRGNDDGGMEAGDAAGAEGMQSGSTPQASDAELLASTWDQLSIAEQKQALLVEQHLTNARALVSTNRLEEAERELSQARALDGDNLEVKQMQNEVGALLGRPAGQTGTLADTLEREWEIRVQQLRVEAEDNLRRGKILLARGDYTEAIGELTLCLDHINWAPYDLDWGGVKEEATTLLQRAKDQERVAAERARTEAQRAAHEELLANERAREERREQKVLNLLDRSISAFRTEHYEEATLLAEDALREDPRNEKAREIKDASFRAGREKVRSDYVRRRREQFLRWQEQIAELMIPYTDEVTLPDKDFWNEITDGRKTRRGIDLTTQLDPSEIELRNNLASHRIPGLIIEDEESLSAVLDSVRIVSGLPLVVDPLAEEAAIDEGAVFNLNLTNPLSVEKALNLIADQAGPEVAWTIRHDAVFFTTREKARGNLVIYNHAVQDLIFGLTDFIGPKIQNLLLIEDLDDEENSPFGGIGEKPTIIDEDDLSTLVQDNVAVGTWEDEGVSITIEMGNMIVVHEPAVQERVKAFLEDLRRFSSTLVTIESKFMQIEDNFIQEIGIEWRGLDNPGTPFTDLDDVTNGLEDRASLGLDNGGTGVAGSNAAGPPSAGFFYDDGGDGQFAATTSNIFGAALGSSLDTIGGLTAQVTFLNDLQASGILRMVEKSSQVELINDQILSVHNTQRAYVTVINQRAYIQDFDVEVAQVEAIADPQVNVLTEGIVLDVRPTIHHDRRYITLEVQPTLAKVVALDTFSTTLGSNTSPVTFSLPELEVQSVFTTVVIPDGGSILLGGLSRIREIERRAEVPWLSNFPLIGFLFKEEGYNNEKSGLMIMIRAWITDVKEELARLEGR